MNQTIEAQQLLKIFWMNYDYTWRNIYFQKIILRTFS